MIIREKIKLEEKNAKKVRQKTIKRVRKKTSRMRDRIY